MVSALCGVKCSRCGTPQMHPIGQNVRVCVACQAKDDFEPYKFSDKTGQALHLCSRSACSPRRIPPASTASSILTEEAG